MLAGVGKMRFLGNLGGGGEGIEKVGFAWPALPLWVRGMFWRRERQEIVFCQVAAQCFCVFLREGRIASCGVVW